MTISYLGRTEATGRRRLGSDLDLITKWYEALVIAKPSKSTSLSELSPADQQKLFEQKCELRLERDSDNKLRLQTIESNEKRVLDPEVAALLHHPNYQRMYERDIQGQQKDERMEDLESDDKSCGVSVSSESPTWNTAFSAVKTASSDSAETIKPAKTGARSTNSSPLLGSDTTVKTRSSSTPQYSSDEPSPVLQAILAGNVSVSPAHFLDAGAPLASSSFQLKDQTTTQYATAVLSDIQETAPQYPDATTPNFYCHLGSGLLNAFLNGTFVAPPGFYQAQLSHNAQINYGSQVDYGSPINYGVQLNPSILSNQTNAAEAQDVFLNTSNPAFPSSYLTNPYGSASYMIPTASRVASFGQFSPLQSVPEASIDGPSPNYMPSAVQLWSGMTCYDVPIQQSGDKIVPEYWTTKMEKAQYLHYKLRDLRLEDETLCADPKAGPIAQNPIHVFIDLSNIIIGFYDCLKLKRGISVQTRIRTPPFSFENFDSILSRGRKATKKVVAGSLGSTNKRRPDYMLEAEKIGYEMNILQRVLKPAPPTQRKWSKGSLREMESATSGPDTSGDDGLTALKIGEQGVDEVLHLKILQSAIDTTERGTIVLATGDAAHAEYSDGFKKNIERVLSLGWNIELYGWRKGISSAWRDPRFIAQWPEQFRIIELDQFSEELLGMTIDSLGGN
ncbi:hypothetical protein QBC47DRAFT_45736 [Echria macrotheca]|uniref:NYN domain-containing protein n=1 Tax=Echria macrotheca TaxID=438768 RepID=A0AAJ0BA38_9PEZI|nr:hypothetical protein QBC47DRAFT_45736 [Echria macrotheca]